MSHVFIPSMQLYFIEESEEPLTDDSEYDKKLPTGNLIMMLFYFTHDGNSIVS